jgi:hypothetical protein
VALTIGTIVLIAIVAASACGATIAARVDDATIHLHVDVAHPRADDTNPGTPSKPLATIGEGLARAYESRRIAGAGTVVFVHPGTYRESIDTVYADVGDAPIVITAVESRRAVVSGADVWTDWQCVEGVCEHAWPYAWGTAPNPWPEAVEIGPLARRSEMVVADGVILDQHLTREALTPGSFHVDETAGVLYVRPVEGTDLSGVIVEVAVRGPLFRAQALHHLVLEGLVFEHAASRFGTAAVDLVDQRNVTLADCVIRRNGQGGLAVLGHDIVVRDCATVENGAGGFGLQRSTGLLLEDIEASWNNWRGARGNYATWGVGHKVMTTRGLTVRRLVSRGNLTRGLWFDTDVSDAVLDDLIVEGNLLDGIFVEAIQGPLEITNATVTANGGAGVLVGTAASLVISNSLIAMNAGEQVRMSGDPTRTFSAYFGDAVVTVRNEGWAMTNNTVIAGGESLLYGTTLPIDDWTVLMSSSRFDNNTYRHEALERVFRVGGGGLVDFATWRSTTGHDADSTFVGP